MNRNPLSSSLTLVLTDPIINATDHPARIPYLGLSLVFFLRITVLTDLPMRRILAGAALKHPLEAGGILGAGDFAVVFV